MRSLSKSKREEISRELGHFLRLYARKAQKGQEPNDRPYSYRVEQILRKLKPEELDVLLNGDKDERI